MLQKQSAREAIAQALDGFDVLGARSWAEKARAELGRLREVVVGVGPGAEAVAEGLGLATFHPDEAEGGDRLKPVPRRAADA